ncbi:zincin [Saccharata proteae CBS 121410]|uniref:Zincin n=1 Tax=Saccharata proteae CBS 121410 TaxID=1314787 RepID=A0A9P4HTS1_9PEZI|nr:zincin [Saccharata proteae CBS 121410]
MHKALLLLASLGALATAADNATDIKHFNCGHDKSHASDNLLAYIKDNNLHQRTYENVGSAAARAKARRDNIAVDAYFHIVTTQAKAGQFTQDMATKQVNAMNTAYNPHGISFNLKGTTISANDKWAVGATDDMTAMKSALRNGTYADLNIYFQSDLTGGILGTCTMPSNLSAGASASIYSSDGCNVNAGTMPGGPEAGYNQGGTAVHETGHWMGLFHTFEGNSCSGDGDLISDTRVESQSTNGCPSGKNSCPDAGSGDDPIHNYMDYSTDACYEDFTSGQEQRMHDLFNQFRAGK